MNVTIKDIMFFLLVFIAILLTCIFNKNQHWILMTSSSLLTTLILLFIYKIGKIDENFEITPEKKCDGGSYLHQSDEYCQKLWETEKGQKQLSQYNCSNQGLFNGRPLNMESRTPMSNDNWENEMCD